MKDKLIKLTLGLVQFLIDVGIVSTFFITFAVVIGDNLLLNFTAVNPWGPPHR